MRFKIKKKPSIRKPGVAKLVNLIKMNENPTPKKKKTKKREVFSLPDDYTEEYTELDQSITNLHETLGEREAARSELLERLLNEYGKGPYEVDGKIVIIVSRKGVYFFRGARGANG
jgi:hypothetical protein